MNIVGNHSDATVTAVNDTWLAFVYGLYNIRIERISNCKFYFLKSLTVQKELHKMDKILAWIAYYVFLFGLVMSKDIDVNSCDGTAKRGDGITCYKVQRIEDTFENSRKQCQTINMDLISVMSDAENDAIIDLMSTSTISEIWINLKVSNSTWRWPDGSELKEQGCYVGHNSMSSVQQINDNSVWTCSEMCKNYTYAGMMSGNECLCGNKFGFNGQIGSHCNISCPSYAADNCGGIDSQRIVAVKGVYSNWLPGQPNDGGEAGESQMCSIIDETFHWNDIECKSSYNAICEINLSSEYFPTCDTKHPGIHSVSGSCIYITDKSMGYFEAIKECARFNGNLLKIPSKEFHDALVNVLIGRFDVLSYWIGTKRFDQVWNSGEKVIFTAWSQDFNLQPGYGFIKRNERPNSQAWNVADENQRKFIICQTTNSTFASIPSYFLTTTTTTSIPLIKHIVTPPPSTTPILPPTVSASKPNEDIKSNPSVPNNQALYGIIGGVVAGGVVLIIIAVVIIFVICKRKRGISAKRHVEESASVQPSYFFGTDNGTMTSKDSISKSIHDSMSTGSSSPPPPPYDT